MTYPRGCPAITRMLIKRERWPGGYKGQYVPLVYPGQAVVSNQPVLRLRQNSDVAPTVSAGLAGHVVAMTHRGGVVIESQAALVRGTIGAGRQVAGILTLWRSNEAHQASPLIPPGAILIVPQTLSFALLRQAISSGVSGIVAGSIAHCDLEGFLRTDLIRLLDTRNIEQAQAYLPPMTLLFTEGLGVAAMPTRIVNFLCRYQGLTALLSGTTSVRLKICPELVISLPLEERLISSEVSPDLVLGSLVRVCGGEHYGVVGVVDYFFPYQQVFPSGIHAHAVRLRLGDGSTRIVPISQIEQIE